MRVIAVDWSGDATGKGQREHVWAATVDDNQLTDLSSGRTRDEVIDFLVSQPDSPDGLIVGLDFAFSFPAWFLRDLGLSDVGGLWDLVAREGEHWLSRCEPPFWGRPGTKRPVLAGHFRLTDSSCQPVAGITPKSVFQIGGAGAVGTGSIRGMPYLRNLRDAGFSIWPFDPPARRTVIEIYPRALTGPVRKSDQRSRERYLHNQFIPGHLRRQAEGSEDAFDAAVSALVMARHFDELADLEPSDHSEVLLEGAIWVPASPPATVVTDSRPGLAKVSKTPQLSDEMEAILHDLDAIEARLQRARHAAQRLLATRQASSSDFQEDT